MPLSVLLHPSKNSVILNAVKDPEEAKPNTE